MISTHNCGRGKEREKRENEYLDNAVEEIKALMLDVISRSIDRERKQSPG